MKTFNTALLVTALFFGSANAVAAEVNTELSSQLTQVLATQVLEVSSNIQQQISASIDATVAELLISVEDTLSQAPAQNADIEQSVAVVE